jgi:hypothetical protein
MADRWLIQFGKSQDDMTTVGKATTRADAAATAQRHHDSQPAEPDAERLVFPPDNPAGDYCCARGFYKITRLATGQYRAVP